MHSRLKVVVMRVPVDTGMVIVIFISMMYLTIVFVLLFNVDNEWCDLLHKNMTVGGCVDSILKHLKKYPIYYIYYTMYTGHSLT